MAIMYYFKIIFGVRFLLVGGFVFTFGGCMYSASVLEFSARLTCDLNNARTPTAVWWLRRRDCQACGTHSGPAGNATCNHGTVCHWCQHWHLRPPVVSIYVCIRKVDKLGLWIIKFTQLSHCTNTCERYNEIDDGAPTAPARGAASVAVPAPAATAAPEGNVETAAGRLWAAAEPTAQTSALSTISKKSSPSAAARATAQQHGGAP